MKKVFFMVALIFSSSAGAKDFGVWGSTFNIIEEPFVKMIQRKLVNVDVEKYQNDMVLKTREKVKNPPAVKGISKTENDREFYFDPTYTLKENAVLPDGKILYKAGTKVNPLDHMDLDRRLIFIDGRDNEQIDWLVQMEKSPNDRIILTAGKILDLEKNLGIKLYFDQSAELTTKFGIKHVPAIVMQAGKLLKINEVKV